MKYVHSAGIIHRDLVHCIAVSGRLRHHQAANEFLQGSVVYDVLVSKKDVDRDGFQMSPTRRHQIQSLTVATSDQRVCFQFSISFGLGHFVSC